MSTDNKLAMVDESETEALVTDNSLQLDMRNMSEDPQGMASVMIGLYMPKYLMGVDKLSSNALRRVLKKLVSYPLNDKEYKSTSQLEADVFNVGERLTEAKFMLMTAHYHELIQQELNNEKAEQK